MKSLHRASRPAILPAAFRLASTASFASSRRTAAGAKARKASHGGDPDMFFLTIRFQPVWVFVVLCGDAAHSARLMGRLVGSGVTAGVVGAIVWFLPRFGHRLRHLRRYRLLPHDVRRQHSAASRASRKAGRGRGGGVDRLILRKFLVRRFKRAPATAGFLRRWRQFWRRRRVGELVERSSMGIKRIGKHLIETSGGCGGSFPQAGARPGIEQAIKAARPRIRVRSALSSKARSTASRYSAASPAARARSIFSRTCGSGTPRTITAC